MITYGTFDLLHAAHIDQLQRARALGTYLIVAVLTDIFDAGRGKRFLAQDVVARCEGVRATGLADIIVLEECDDKINNVLKYGVDVCAVFDSWEGPGAYTENLRRYCEVVCIPEVEGAVSSTKLRGVVRLSAWGDVESVKGLVEGAKVTGGVELVSLPKGLASIVSGADRMRFFTGEEVYDDVDAVFIASELDFRAQNVSEALHRGKHVLCTGPMSTSSEEVQRLFAVAARQGLVLVESLPSAFTPAIERMTAVAQNGKIGRVLSVALNLNVPFNAEQASRDHKGPLCVDEVSEALLPVVRILHGREIRGVQCATLPSGKKDDPGHLCQLKVDFEAATAFVNIGHGLILPETLMVTGSEGFLTMSEPWRTASGFHLRFRDVNFEEASDTQDFQLSLIHI